MINIRKNTRAKYYRSVSLRTKKEKRQLKGHTHIKLHQALEHWGRTWSPYIMLFIYVSFEHETFVTRTKVDQELIPVEIQFGKLTFVVFE